MPTRFRGWRFQPICKSGTNCYIIVKARKKSHIQTFILYYNIQLYLLIPNIIITVLLIDVICPIQSFLSGLVRLQQLFQVINKKEMNLDIVVKRIVSVQLCHQMLRGIYNTELKEDLRLLIDLTITKAEELITAVVSVQSSLY